MAFTSKNLHKSSRGGLGFLKGATLFFLGMSCVMFLTRAYLVIQPSAANTQTVFEKLILTLGGDPIASTGVYLDGSGGDAYFAGKVGIGVNSPVSRLHINGEMRSNSIYVDTPDGVSIGDKYIGGLNEVQGIFFQDGTSLSDVIAAKMLAVGRLLAGDNIRVTTGGNVGIGTTNPNQKFEVAGNMRFTTDGYLEAGTNPNQLYLKNNGNVGIGTTNPSGKLTVNGNIAFPSGGDRNISIGQNLVGYGDNLLIAAGGSDDLAGGGYVKIRGGGGNGGEYGNVLLVESGSEGGNVGIGTSSPTAKLHVDGNVKVGSNLSLFSATPYGIIQSSSWLQFNTNGGSPRITISNLGNVGIGTTNPSTKLHVAGITKIDSSVQIWNEAGNARCNGTGDRGKMVYINMCYATGGNLIYTPTFLGCVGSGENGYFKKAFMTGASWTESGSLCSSIYEIDNVISQAGGMIRFN